MINIQEPKCEKLANLLKGIVIFMKYDCTADIYIGVENFYYPSYCVDISANSQDFDKEDLQELSDLG